MKIIYTKELEQQEFERVATLMLVRNSVFVFGSNEAGRHGAGAAHHALLQYGAQYGLGVGLSGRSYAVPTKDHSLHTLPVWVVREHVMGLRSLAATRDDLNFVVTRLGCGLAGYTDDQIAPLFKGAPVNCLLPYLWREFNGEET